MLDPETMPFPLVTSRIVIGGRAWQITAVQNQEALLDAVDTLENMPYGFLLWESAIGLGRYLAANPALVADRQALELGCGVGLVGLIARRLGARVRQTDHQPGVLALARRNAAQNAVHGIEQFLADWRHWEHTERYDLLLGADILYERAMHPYLERIFRANLAPQGALLLSDPVRPQALEFTSQLEKAGWSIALETIEVQLEESGRQNRAVEVALWIGTLP